MIYTMKNVRHSSSDILPCNLSKGTFWSSYVTVVVSLQDNSFEELRRITSSFLKSYVLSVFGSNQISFVIK